MATILIVDDEEKICFAFKLFLNKKGHETLIAPNAADGIALVRGNKPEIIFLDIRLPGKSGLELIEEIKSTHPEGRVIVMTAHGTMDTAIDAMRKGAYDYLTKPIDLDRVDALIQKIIQTQSTSGMLLRDGNPEPAPSAPVTLIGRSPAIQEIYKMIGLLTTNDVPVLIEGESGVGKELVARAIHYKSSRAGEPFVAINCGAMPDQLLESELFGHEKGAFTGADTLKVGKFEHAARGTIFLDEIGDLKFPLQIKLLRVLQERQIVRVGGLDPVSVHARVLTATNKSLEDEVKTGNFRPDLYYRLQLVSLKIPPLRERREDIEELTQHFIGKANSELNRNIKGMSQSAFDQLMTYSWPGNVRELENTIKRAVILSRGDTIETQGIQLKQTVPSNIPDDSSEEEMVSVVQGWFDRMTAVVSSYRGRIYPDIIQTVEKSLLTAALKACDDNQVHTAELLGMSRSTLRKKIKEYHL